MRNQPRTHRPLHGLALLSATALACGPSAAPPDAGFDAAPAPDAPTPEASPDTVNPADSAPQSACTPDPAQVASRRACRADDQCPCGAHCALGQCVATCSASAPCPGSQRCDLFGRCAAPDAVRTDLGAAPPSPNALLFADPMLTMTSASSVVAVRFRAVAGPVGPVRIAAPSGWQLQCAPMGEFGSECLDATVTAGTERVVNLRATPGTSPTEVGVVRVFWGSEMATVGVQPPSSAARDASSLAGLYAGSATLVDVALGEGATLTARPVAAELSVPIEASVFSSASGGSGVLALRDPLGALSPSGQWVGALAVTAATGDGTLTLPAQRVASPALDDPMNPTPYVNGLGTEVLASPSPSAYAFEPVSRTITVTVPVRFEGVLENGRTAQVRWRLNLARTGDLPASTTRPPVPAADTLSSIARTATQSPWESAARGLLVWTGAVDARSARGLIQSMGDAVPANTSWDPTICAPTAALGSADLGFLVQDTFRSGNTQTPGTSATAAVAALDAAGYYLHSAVLRPASGATVNSLAISNVAAFPADGVPCQFAIAPQANGCGAGVVATFGTVDHCAEIAQNLGCVPTDVGSVAHSLSFDYQLNATGGTCPLRAGTPHLTATVTRVCRPPVVDSCGELITCMEPDGTTSVPGDATRSSAAVLPLSGDLRCRAVSAGAPARTVATAADYNRDNGGADSVGQVVFAALTDLARLRNAPPVLGTPGVGPGLATLAGTPHAIDAVRLLVALSYATDAGRTRAAGGNVSAPRSARFAQRLLQQWLQVHAQVAMESGQRAAVPSSLRGVVTDTLVPAPDEALTASLNGWDLFLHPHFAAALEAMESAALDQPDYRQQGLNSVPPGPELEQPLGVVLSMLRTLRAQLSATSVLLDRAARAGNGTVPPQVGRMLRTSALLLPWIEELHARASASAAARGGTLPWENTFQSERGQLLTTLRTSIGAANGIYQHRNPLGIEDVDQPLYLFGSTADPRLRFSAVSDYLLGVGAMSPGWAPTLVTQAQSSAAALGVQYQAQAQRQYELAYANRDLQDRLDNINSQYGGQIASVCGLPPGTFSYGVLEGWPGFDAERCFLRTEDPACQPDQSALDALLTTDDVRYQLCVASEIGHNSPGTTARLSAPLRHLLDDNTGDTVGSCAFPTACVGSGELHCVTCGADSAPLSALQLRVLSDYMQQNNDAVAADAIASCQARYPAAHATLPSPDQLPSNPLNRTDCYRGSMGELMLAVRAAQADVDSARAEQDENVQNYDIAMRSCYLQQQGNAAVDAANTAHDHNMHNLAVGKLAADVASHVAGAVKDCMAAAAASDPITDAVTAGALLGVGCGAAATEAAADSVSDGLQFAMDEAQRAHDSEVTMLMGQTDVLRCVNDAGMQLVGAASAALRVTRALLDLEAARYRLTEARTQAAQLFAEGNDSLAYERGRQVRPPALDAWTNSAVSDFRARMSAARRLTYLAVRAVEYEYQSSSSLRSQVLAAETPADLQAVIDALRMTAGPRDIGGHAPSSLKVVVSLRQNLLQLADRSGSNSPSVQPLSDVERFRLLLQDPRFAVYDASGVYQGQQVPFSVAPLASLRVGDPSGVAIFSSTDCAERIWSVNASLLGTDAVRGGSSFARVDLLKSNTFYSQWCAAPSGSPPFQAASVRPSLNLFVDPTFSSASGMVGGDLGIASAADAFTRARLQPVVNVARATFEDDQYANGMSTELAARGLYGDYALFLSAQQIARRNADGTYTQGIDLNALDDILLRIDYVSVAR